MNIQLLHGGQTGVDRGAHDAALENGWEIAGYMPKDARDELGLIPLVVSRFLHRCTLDGYPARTRVNVDMAHVVLVVVEDRHRPYATPGTRLTLQTAAALGRPHGVVDPRVSAEDTAKWLWLMAKRAERDPLRVMVAGPRASRWTDGQVETRMLLRNVHLFLMEGNEW
jgi:hypothetical protein